MFTAIGLLIAVLPSARPDFRPSTTTPMPLHHAPASIIARACLLQERPRFGQLGPKRGVAFSGAPPRASLPDAAAAPGPA